MTKILMSNLGYLRGINGRLAQHLFYAHRHFYCSITTQKKSLCQLADLIEKEDPDICCFVEVDSGSTTSANFNQFEAILSEHYPYFDSENKYGLTSRLRTSPRTRGKSNAFMAKQPLEYEKIYFTHGTKRLIYKIRVTPDLTLFFTHFSLKKAVRAQQLLQIRRMMEETPGEHIFLGDFNIWTGFAELAPLLHENNLHLSNKDDHFTFTFHRFQKVLDLCVCSKTLEGRLSLRVLPQSFSDHAALLVEIT